MKKRTLVRVLGAKKTFVAGLTLLATLLLVVNLVARGTLVVVFSPSGSRDRTLLRARLIKREREFGDLVAAVGKRWSRRREETFKTEQRLYEQARRRANVRRVCEQYRASGAGTTATAYEAVTEKFSQTVDTNFLIHDASRSIYCYNHKAASTTWMALYSELNSDGSFLREARQSGNYYRIQSHLRPWSGSTVLEKSALKQYFTFTVVRNPFDRILSAYRDRILNGCTDQAKQHVPHIIGRRPSYDLSGCVSEFPPFAQFLSYVANGAAESDLHWRPVATNCAPCIVDYDAIVKLETSGEDERFVLERSGIGRLLRGGGGIQHMYESAAGSSSASAAVRQKYFSGVPCDVLERLYADYAMDFELFEYDEQPFFELCEQ